MELLYQCVSVHYGGGHTRQHLWWFCHVSWLSALAHWWEGIWGCTTQGTLRFHFRQTWAWGLFLASIKTWGWGDCVAKNQCPVMSDLPFGTLVGRLENSLRSLVFKNWPLEGSLGSLYTGVLLWADRLSEPLGTFPRPAEGLRTVLSYRLEYEGGQQGSRSLVHPLTLFLRRELPRGKGTS